MTSVAAIDNKADWMIISESVLRESNYPSLDNLLDDAVDIWLERLEPELRWRVAVNLYISEEVSIGRAAEIAGLNYFVFENKLRQNGICFIDADVSDEGELDYQKQLINAAFNLPHA